MKNSYINKKGQVIQPKDLEKTMDELNGAVDKAKLYPTPVNADKGKYLKYDESGKLIYDDVPTSEIPTITIAQEQITSTDPLEFTLTSAQIQLIGANEQILFEIPYEGVDKTIYNKTFSNPLAGYQFTNVTVSYGNSATRMYAHRFLFLQPKLLHTYE